MTQVSPASPYTTLQGLLWPEPGLNTERDLYVRLRDAVGMDLETRALLFAAGGRADFGTYCNLFNFGKWHRHCGLSDLRLALEGLGTFELVVFCAEPDRSWSRLVNDVITLAEGTPHEVDLGPRLADMPQAVLFFELRALGNGCLRDARWQTSETPKRTPDLMLSVTTFRREAAVARTVARFEAFVAGSALKDHLHLTVVDNGQSAEIASGSHVTVLPNENLGGAGGFSRGLLEARRRGASHCLFMDDDAAVHMEALERTWLFLAHATDPATAVAGAMADAQNRWQMWENGAIFDRGCRPRHIGTDMRVPQAVMEMELASTAPVPGNFYGGWWYFAFPVAEARHMPFPFFVRGDDVSFSLVHDFNIVTLPGVMSFQDENFGNKESLQTLYLDLRSHLAHHMALPAMDIGRSATLRLAARFFARSLVQCHYETLAALNLAIEDFMAGPDFFAENADMATRRADLAGLRHDEAWKDMPHPPAKRRRFNPNLRVVRWLMVATLNGHLIPFFPLIGDRAVLPAGKRGAPHHIWGASEITYVNGEAGTGFTVRHSKRRAWREFRRFAGLAWRFWRDYDRLKAEWQAGYPRLASEDFWRGRLGLAAPRTPGAPVAAPDPVQDPAQDPVQDPAQDPVQDPAQDPVQDPAQDKEHAHG